MLNVIVFNFCSGRQKVIINTNTVKHTHCVVVLNHVNYLNIIKEIMCQ